MMIDILLLKHPSTSTDPYLATALAAEEDRTGLINFFVAQETTHKRTLRELPFSFLLCLLPRTITYSKETKVIGEF